MAQQLGSPSEEIPLATPIDEVPPSIDQSATDFILGEGFPNVCWPILQFSEHSVGPTSLPMEPSTDVVIPISSYSQPASLGAVMMKPTDLPGVHSQPTTPKLRICESILKVLTEECERSGETQQQQRSVDVKFILPYLVNCHLLVFSQCSKEEVRQTLRRCGKHIQYAREEPNFPALVKVVCKPSVVEAYPLHSNGVPEFYMCGRCCQYDSFNVECVKDHIQYECPPRFSHFFMATFPRMVALIVGCSLIFLVVLSLVG